MTSPVRVKVYAVLVFLLAVTSAAVVVSHGTGPSILSSEFLLLVPVAFLFAHFGIQATPDVAVILLMPLVLAFLVIKGSMFGVALALTGNLLSSMIARSAWEKAAFNNGLIMLEATAAAAVYEAFGAPAAASISGPLFGILLLMSVADWLINMSVFAGLLALLSSESYWKKLTEMAQLSVKHVAVDALVATLMISLNLSMGLLGTALIAALLFLTRYGYQAYYKLRTSYEEVQVMLISILDARDSYTAGHSVRVAENAVLLATELKLAPREIENLRRAALLHDIGKVNVPDQVLKKPGKLSEEETVQMNQHPVDGARFVDSVSSLKHLTPIILHHHERLDGKGYPEGLKGVEIPFGARILLVADAFDAMTTDRPYRGAMTRAEALRRIIEGAGTQFDPTVAWAAVRVFGAELPEYAELKALQQWVEREAAATRQVDPPEGKA